MQTDSNSDRTMLRLSGSDRIKFLQGLVTNDVGASQSELTYAALLTPQGKYLADFFMFHLDEAIILDVAAPLALSLAQRLTMYRLRSDVTIEPANLHVCRGTDGAPEGAFADPRHPDLGWRLYSNEVAQDAENVDWAALNIACGVPTSGVELIPNESYILEMNFEALNGVDFRKGCYVGQEVTARMKHKTSLRKGLAQVKLSKQVPVGTDLLSDGKKIGTVYSQSQNNGLAYVRFDRADGDLSAGDAEVTLIQNTL